MDTTIVHCGSNKVYPGASETMWCEGLPGHEGDRHWQGNVSWVDDKGPELPLVGEKS